MKVLHAFPSPDGWSLMNNEMLSIANSRNISLNLLAMTVTKEAPVTVISYKIGRKFGEYELDKVSGCKSGEKYDATKL